MIIKSCGFIEKDLIRSKNVINFAYILFLTLKDKGVDSGMIAKYVQKWFVMSILTGRYSGSPESKYDYDIKKIHKEGVDKYLNTIEDSELSDTFWSVGLVDQIDRAIVTNPLINVFFAAQVKENDKGFLSSDITVANMINHKGDVHHIFPKAYLRSFSMRQGEYNQIANYAYAQSEINIKIGKKPPKEYMQEVLNQCEGESLKYGGITGKKELYENLEQHCIPKDIFEMDVNDYERFLEERRKMIADKIKNYYFELSSKDENQKTHNENYLKTIEAGENDYIEFKSSLRWDYKNKEINKGLEHAIVKTLAAFMNSNGGKLFIGVNDNGEILGLEKDYKIVKNQNKDGFLLQLTQAINNYLGKKFHQYLIIDIIKINNKDVCVVEVLNSGKPVYVQNKEKDKQEFFIRASASTQPLDMKEANDYIKNHWPNM